MNTKTPFGKSPLAVFLFALAGLILIAIIGVFFLKPFYEFFAKGFGLNEKSEVLKYLGITFLGRCWPYNKFIFTAELKQWSKMPKAKPKPLNCKPNR